MPIDLTLTMIKRLRGFGRVLMIKRLRHIQLFESLPPHITKMQIPRWVSAFLYLGTYFDRNTGRGFTFLRQGVHFVVRGFT